MTTEWHVNETPTADIKGIFLKVHLGVLELEDSIVYKQWMKITTVPLVWHGLQFYKDDTKQVSKVTVHFLTVTTWATRIEVRTEGLSVN